MVASPSLAVLSELVFLDFYNLVYSTDLPFVFFSLLLYVFSSCILSVFLLGSTSIGLPLCNPFLLDIIISIQRIKFSLSLFAVCLEG